MIIINLHKRKLERTMLISIINSLAKKIENISACFLNKTSILKTKQRKTL